MLHGEHLMHLYVHAKTNEVMRMKIWSEDSEWIEKDLQQLFSQLQI